MKEIKQMETPGNWGSWTHEEATEEFVDPNGDRPVYGMYPSPWRPPTTRETSAARQQRMRDEGAGLGQPYDAEYLASVPQRDISAELAANAVSSQVKLRQ
jgi:hypothetical protein